MSLGYQRGNTWVVDTVYQRFTEWDTYSKLIHACRMAGFAWDCQYSYTGKCYHCEITTIEKRHGTYYIIKHGNAYDPHPMIALTKAIRKHPHSSPLVTVLCVEMDIRIIAEKLLRPCVKLGNALDDLTITIEALT